MEGSQWSVTPQLHQSALGKREVVRGNNETAWGSLRTGWKKTNAAAHKKQAFELLAFLAAAVFFSLSVPLTFYYSLCFKAFFFLFSRVGGILYPIFSQ